MSSPSAPPPPSTGQSPARPPSLRLAYVPGVTPAKWTRIWSERHPDVAVELHQVSAHDAAGAIRRGEADVALLRLPSDVDDLSVIRLYDEVVVVLAPTDHVLTAVDEVSADDLRDETTLVAADDVVDWPDRPGRPHEHHPDDTAAAVELAATGMGVVLLPQSLARLHHRKDLTYRPVLDAPAAPVALAFAAGSPAALVDEFIGIARGRKATSSRGSSTPPPKRTAREKTLAKQAARAASGKHGTSAGSGKAARGGGKPARGGDTRRGRR